MLRPDINKATVTGFVFVHKQTDRFQSGTIRLKRPCTDTESNVIMYSCVNPEAIKKIKNGGSYKFHGSMASYYCEKTLRRHFTGQYKTERSEKKNGELTIFNVVDVEPIKYGEVVNEGVVSGLLKWPPKFFSWSKEEKRFRKVAFWISCENLKVLSRHYSFNILCHGGRDIAEELKKVRLGALIGLRGELFAAKWCDDINNKDLRIFKNSLFVKKMKVFDYVE